MTTKLHPFVFPDSGKRISIRKVSPFIADELRKQFPPPQPPKQKVMVGDEEREEENPAHPDYQKALRQYNWEFGQKIQKLMIRRGVVIELSEEDRQEVAELRADLATDGIALSENDKEVYLWQICISTPQDLQDLANAIAQRAQPTEKEIQANLDNFRG